MVEPTVVHVLLPLWNVVVLVSTRAMKIARSGLVWLWTCVVWCVKMVVVAVVTLIKAVRDVCVVLVTYFRTYVLAPIYKLWITMITIMWCVWAVLKGEAMMMRHSVHVAVNTIITTFAPILLTLILTITTADTVCVRAMVACGEGVSAGVNVTWSVIRGFFG